MGTLTVRRARFHKTDFFTGKREKQPLSRVSSSSHPLEQSEQTPLALRAEECPQGEGCEKRVQHKYKFSNQSGVL